MEFDEVDKNILRILQLDSRKTLKEISKELRLPITTVHARIKRLEKLGVIKCYTVVLDNYRLGKPITAFIFASFSKSEGISQREIIERIAKMHNVQEVHIITGDWDILVKIKEKDVDSVGKFIVDELRALPGIEKTLTIFVLQTGKEAINIPI